RSSPREIADRNDRDGRGLRAEDTALVKAPPRRRHRAVERHALFRSGRTARAVSLAAPRLRATSAEAASERARRSASSARSAARTGASAAGVGETIAAPEAIPASALARMFATWGPKIVGTPWAHA